MAGSPSIAILVPALDCQATIAQVVGEALEYIDTILVVDDGSNDGTSGVARSAGAAVVRNETNLGKGFSLRRGMTWLQEHSFSHALTMDGDAQHLSSEIPKLLEASSGSEESIILGRRVFDRSVVSPSRLFGNRFADRWVEIACGQTIADTQSGYRVYPIEPTLALNASADRFAYETEVLIKAARAGVPIVSVPVETYYPPANERESHFRPFADTLRIIRVVLGLILRRGQ